jgi:hypothetical protein
VTRPNQAFTTPTIGTDLRVHLSGCMSPDIHLLVSGDLRLKVSTFDLFVYLVIVFTILAGPPMADMS